MAHACYNQTKQQFAEGQFWAYIRDFVRKRQGKHHKVSTLQSLENLDSLYLAFPLQKCTQDGIR